MESIDKPWELVILCIFDTKFPCQGSNIAKLEIFEDIFRHSLVKRNIADFFSGHKENFSYWRLLHFDDVVANNFFIVVQHKMRHFKEPGIDSSDIGSDWWRFWLNYFVLFLLAGGSGKSELQRADHFDVIHDSLLKDHLFELHYQRVFDF